MTAAVQMPVERIRSALDRAALLVSAGDALPLSVSDVSDDSRTVRPGSLFVAVRGGGLDGHDYLADAAAKGAVAAIVEDASRTTLPALVVLDARRAAAVAASAAFDHPARALRIVGVTGTNGKTTTVGIARHLLDALGAPSASIGTLGALIGSEGRALPGASGLTTPGPVELQRMLRALVNAGVRSVAMEVSSHSLDQRRVDEIQFDAVVFTNLTRDHLDYHHTIDAYFEAKAKLLTHLRPDGTAVVNADDPAWEKLPHLPNELRFGIAHTQPDAVWASKIAFGPAGSEFTISLPYRGARGQAPFVASARLPLIGDFNIANALGAAAAALALGGSPAEIVERLASVPQVPGRLELINECPMVLRDYAHTPDALERSLTAVRPFVRHRLIVVFGAGGDRDRGKRAAMGAIAAKHADIAIVTSDNPRTEDPERIVDDIEQGMNGAEHVRQVDRRAAIQTALATAHVENDVVLLAGKGHETYQVRGTTKYPFDERAIVREILEES
ncbi:MAG: UDP-N-acetylmuramoyl-L-alanyl-D-glutamate--2,6-diaminopimelate ligase [Gemmatimonadaceae bacterium]